jgi:hypothetical protein
METKDLFFDYDTMFKLYSVEGKTLECIGEMFNKSRAQVFNNMKKLKIGRYDYKKQLHNEGKSICSKCGEIKEITSFILNKKREVLNGIKNTCKSCDSEIGRDWYEKNTQLTKDRAKKHREENLEKHRELSRKKVAKSRKNKPHIHRLKGLLSRFIKATKQNKTMTTTVMLGYSYDDFKNFVNESKLPLEGNHVDHKCPISWFKEDVPASVANSLDNLQIITEHENETKSQWWSHPISEKYYEIIKVWIKDEYLQRFIKQQDFYVDIKTVFYTS